jgi:hypothetical protein
MATRQNYTDDQLAELIKKGLAPEHAAWLARESWLKEAEAGTAAQPQQVTGGFDPPPPYKEGQQQNLRARTAEAALGMSPADLKAQYRQFYATGVPPPLVLADLEEKTGQRFPHPTPMQQPTAPQAPQGPQDPALAATGQPFTIEDVPFQTPAEAGGPPAPLGSTTTTVRGPSAAPMPQPSQEELRGRYVPDPEPTAQTVGVGGSIRQRGIPEVDLPQYAEGQQIARAGAVAERRSAELAKKPGEIAQLGEEAANLQEGAAVDVANIARGEHEAQAAAIQATREIAEAEQSRQKAALDAHNEAIDELQIKDAAEKKRNLAWQFDDIEYAEMKELQDRYKGPPPTYTYVKGEDGRMQEIPVSDTVKAEYIKTQREIEAAFEAAGQTKRYDDFGQKIMAAIAIGLGAFGAGMTGGPNTALQIVNQGIQERLENQKELQAQRQAGGLAIETELGNLQKKYVSNEAAKAMFVAQDLQRVKSQLEQVMAEYGVERVTPELKDMLAQITGMLEESYIKAYQLELPALSQRNQLAVQTATAQTGADLETRRLNLQAQMAEQEMGFKWTAALTPTATEEAKFAIPGMEGNAANSQQYDKALAQADTFGPLWAAYTRLVEIREQMGVEYFLPEFAHTSLRDEANGIAADLINMNRVATGSGANFTEKEIELITKSGNPDDLAAWGNIQKNIKIARDRAESRFEAKMHNRGFHNFKAWKRHMRKAFAMGRQSRGAALGGEAAP